MKKYVCLFIVTLLVVSGVFVGTGKAGSDARNVTVEDLENMSLAELYSLIKEMDAEVEMKTRQLRQAFAEGLVEDYAPNHSGYLLFQQHYPNTTKFIEDKVSLALASGKMTSTKGGVSAIAENVRDLPWTLFDSINVVDSIHEDFLRADITNQHPDWSLDHINYHVEQLSDEHNRRAAENQGAFARWFTDKRIRVEAARESKERADQARAHRLEHGKPPNLQGVPNGMDGPAGHILGRASGPGNEQRGGGLDSFYFGQGGRICQVPDQIIYGPDG